MYKVLLAIDSDEQRATKAAEAVRSLPGSPADLDVTILNVFEEFDVSDGESRVRSEDFFDESDSPDSVSAVEAILEEEGISVATRLEHGDPAETIVSIADEIDADAIAIAGRKRSPAGKVLFGSVAQAVMLSADQPVLVVIED